MLARAAVTDPAQLLTCACVGHSSLGRCGRRASHPPCAAWRTVCVRSAGVGHPGLSRLTTPPAKPARVPWRQAVFRAVVFGSWLGRCTWGRWPAKRTPDPPDFVQGVRPELVARRAAVGVGRQRGLCLCLVREVLLDPATAQVQRKRGGSESLGMVPSPARAPRYWWRHR